MAPLWARVLRQVAIWGGAVVLAGGTYIGSTVAASAFLDDQDDETPLADAAEALGGDLVYVDPRAAGVLDEADVTALEEQAAEASQPTRIAVWPLDGGWLPDVAEYVAARSGLESRFLLVGEDGRTAVASTLDEWEPSIDDTEGLPAAAAAAQALKELDATPLTGEPEEYDDGGQPVGSVWLATAVGGGLGLATVLVAASGVVVVVSSVLLAVMFGLLAVLAYRRRKAARPSRTSRRGRRSDAEGIVSPTDLRTTS